MLELWADPSAGDAPGASAYARIVDARVTTLGCGVASCGFGELLVCRYGTDRADDLRIETEILDSPK